LANKKIEEKQKATATLQGVLGQKKNPLSPLKHPKNLQHKIDLNFYCRKKAFGQK